MFSSVACARAAQLVGLSPNGVRETRGQVAVANFDNPAGPEKAGGSLYRGTANSGVADVGVAGNGGRGTMASGSLELSNGDPAQEGTNLIIAQRGLQAKLKISPVSDGNQEGLGHPHRQSHHTRPRPQGPHRMAFAPMRRPAVTRGGSGGGVLGSQAETHGEAGTAERTRKVPDRGPCWNAMWWRAGPFTPRHRRRRRRR